MHFETPTEMVVTVGPHRGEFRDQQSVHRDLWAIWLYLISITRHMYVCVQMQNTIGPMWAMSNRQAVR